VTRVSYVGEDGETFDFAAEEAERLDRDPELRREYDKWQAMTRGRGGALIVLDAERVRRALAWKDGAEGDL
jgi:hypothetical protein